MISVKTMIKNSVILCFTLFLVGCSWFQVDRPTETVLSHNLPAPLELNSVEWKVIQYNNLTYYSLDSQNFTNLSLNMQEVQDRLHLYNTLLESQNKAVDISTK